MWWRLYWAYVFRVKQNILVVEANQGLVDEEVIGSSFYSQSSFATQKTPNFNEKYCSLQIVDTFVDKQSNISVRETIKCSHLLRKIGIIL
jgi:hypothetical protein